MASYSVNDPAWRTPQLIEARQYDRAPEWRHKEIQLAHELLQLFDATSAGR